MIMAQARWSARLSAQARWSAQQSAQAWPHW
jgi:hypothetical protein